MITADAARRLVQVVGICGSLRPGSHSACP